MILQALSGYYERIAATGDVAEEGYADEHLDFQIILDRNGRLIDIAPRSSLVGKRVVRGPKCRVPKAPADRSGKKYVASFLWDRSDYALGLAKNSEKNARPVVRNETFNAFKEKHLALLKETSDPVLVALRKFVEQWNPANPPPNVDFEQIAGLNVGFALDGSNEWAHSCVDAKRIWMQASVAHVAPAIQCLITGMEGPLARLHADIKNITGQTNVGPFVSINNSAFESYGKSQGANAPVSKRAAHAYATALNHLLSASRGVNAKGRTNYTNRVQIGDSTTVFFAKAKGGPEKLKQAVAEEEFVLSMMEPPPEPPSDEEEAKRLHEKFRSIEAGRPLKEIDSGLDPETRFFVIGISPNAARLSVRFFEDTSLGDLSRRMGQHWVDLHIEPNDWRTPPSFWRLLRATAPLEDMDRVSPALAGELARATFAGTRYPQALLSLTLMRLRAGDEPDAIRVAIIKACIARNHRLGFEEEDVPVSLDLNETNAGYRLGRLFAVLENAQYAALGKINAGIRDKFYSSASAAPARIFPLLVRGAQDHIAKIRKTPSKSGLSIWFDRRIAEIVDGLPASVPFPAILRLEDQGRFAVGYYHERNRAKSEGKSAEQLEETTGDEE